MLFIKHFPGFVIKSLVVKSLAVTSGVAVLFMLSFMTVNAESILELEETEITGARELPKVLYIVPWKKARPDSRPLPMRSLIDEALAPIDVDEFKRQIRYHEMTQSPAGNAK